MQGRERKVGERQGQSQIGEYVLFFIDIENNQSTEESAAPMITKDSKRHMQDQS